MNTDFLPVLYTIEAAMALAAVLAVAIMIGLAVDAVRGSGRRTSETTEARHQLRVAFGRLSHQG